MGLLGGELGGVEGDSNNSGDAGEVMEAVEWVVTTEKATAEGATKGRRRWW